MDLHSILATHRSNVTLSSKSEDNAGVIASPPLKSPEDVHIPALFFDRILVDYKLARIEIMVLMYLYRKVYCTPNLYRKYGISPLLSLSEVCSNLNIELEDVHVAVSKLENLGMVETIRLGQYFVRRYFTKNYDTEFNQTYEDFDF